MKRSAPLFVVGALGLAACADQGLVEVGDGTRGLTPPSRSVSASAEEVEFVPGQIIVRFRRAPRARRSRRRTAPGTRRTCGSSAW
jgi:hypothetical protein